MASARSRTERRTDALSRHRIVDTAVRILDGHGIDALTFRALARDLSTGAGALYHYVANKGDLLAAATTYLLAAAIDGADDRSTGAPDVRTMMTGVFQVIVEHPWVGTQLAAEPWQPVVLELFDRIGSRLSDLGVPEERQFDAASVLVHFILGTAGQYNAGTKLPVDTGGRADFIAGAVVHADATATATHPFLTRMSTRLATHDDREQFEAGLDIILAGIAAASPALSRPIASVDP